MKVKYGLKNVHIAVMDEEGTYQTPFALEGAVNLSLDAEGDKSNLAADDNANYFVKYVNNGYTGDLEVALINEDFLTKVLGQTKDENGVVTENKGDTIKSFALMFEINGDTSKRRTVLYNCTVSRPSIEASTTEDSIEPQTETLELTASEDKNGNVRSFVDSEQAAYADFFKSVYQPATV